MIKKIFNFGMLILFIVFGNLLVINRVSAMEDEQTRNTIQVRPIQAIQGELDFAKWDINVMRRTQWNFRDYTSIILKNIIGEDIKEEGKFSCIEAALEEAINEGGIERIEYSYAKSNGYIISRDIYCNGFMKNIAKTKPRITVIMEGENLIQLLNEADKDEENRRKIAYRKKEVKKDRKRGEDPLYSYTKARDPSFEY